MRKFVILLLILVIGVSMVESAKRKVKRKGTKKRKEKAVEKEVVQPEPVEEEVVAVTDNAEVELAVKEEQIEEEPEIVEPEPVKEEANTTEETELIEKENEYPSEEEDMPQMEEVDDEEEDMPQVEEIDDEEEDVHQMEEFDDGDDNTETDEPETTENIDIVQLHFDFMEEMAVVGRTKFLPLYNTIKSNTIYAYIFLSILYIFVLNKLVLNCFSICTKKSKGGVVDMKGPLKAEFVNFEKNLINKLTEHKKLDLELIREEMKQNEEFMNFFEKNVIDVWKEIGQIKSKLNEIDNGAFSNTNSFATELKQTLKATEGDFSQDKPVAKPVPSLEKKECEPLFKKVEEPFKMAEPEPVEKIEEPVEQEVQENGTVGEKVEELAPIEEPSPVDEPSPVEHEEEKVDKPPTPKIKKKNIFALRGNFKKLALNRPKLPKRPIPPIKKEEVKEEVVEEVREEPVDSSPVEEQMDQDPSPVEKSENELQPEPQKEEETEEMPEQILEETPISQEQPLESPVQERIVKENPFSNTKPTTKAPELPKEAPRPIIPKFRKPVGGIKLGKPRKPPTLNIKPKAPKPPNPGQGS